jgi:succinate dehydrogenase / fumarate reductase cytochrome b subunit
VLPALGGKETRRTHSLEITKMAEATELRRGAGEESMVGSLVTFAMSSVGSKVVMAVTGMYLWIFLCGHLAGNLLLYVGQDAFNHYAATLQHTPLLVWGNRIAMLLLFPVHIFSAIRTARLNMEARPEAYAYANNSPSRMAAKTMILSGLVVLAFFLFHLANFTWHNVGPQPTALLANGEHDAFTMVVMSFTQPAIAFFYVLAVMLLAAHLSHGLYSMFQHLGVWGKKWTPFLQTAALVVGYGMCAAFASLPLAVFFGVVKP